MFLAVQLSLVLEVVVLKDDRQRRGSALDGIDDVGDLERGVHGVGRWIRRKIGFRIAGRQVHRKHG